MTDFSCGSERTTIVLFLLQSMVKLQVQTVYSTGLFIQDDSATVMHLDSYYNLKNLDKVNPAAYGSCLGR